MSLPVLRRLVGRRDARKGLETTDDVSTVLETGECSSLLCFDRSSAEFPCRDQQRHKKLYKSKKSGYPNPSINDRFQIKKAMK